MFTKFLNSIIPCNSKFNYKQLNLELVRPKFPISESKQMLLLINEVRIFKGVQVLKWDERLYNVASAYSYNMFKNTFFSHTDLNGNNHLKRILHQVPLKSIRTCGENLAINSNINSAHIALCNSKGHFENIINPNYFACGIGVFSPNPDYVWVTQLFLG